MTDTHSRFLEPGSLMTTVEAIERDIVAGKIAPREAPAPGTEYIPPIYRASANRLRGPAFLRFLDVRDRSYFGDDQRSAPQGVLNPSSPYFQHNYDFGKRMPDYSGQAEAPAAVPEKA